MRRSKHFYILIPVGVYALFLLAYWFIFANRTGLPGIRLISLASFVLFIALGVLCSILMKRTRNRKVIKNIIYGTSFLICILLSYQMILWIGADFELYIWYAVLSFFYGRVIGNTDLLIKRDKNS
jgi:hypothetical protein